MAHGYLEEGYGMWGDFDPDREGRDRDRERSWRDRERDWRERDRGFMFDRDRDRELDWRDRGDDRSEWFGGRERGDERMSHYGREHGYGGFQGDYSRSGREQGGFGGFGDYDRGRRSFGSSQDDHYRSWRDRQMQALDRDYADYCREREQQFHQDFDSWRQNRQGNPQPLQTGMTQSGLSADPTGMHQARSETNPAETRQDPEAAATLETTSSGRSRR